jgi:hypothetical protein
MADGKTLFTVMRFDGNAGCGGIVAPSAGVPVRTSTHYTVYHQASHRRSSHSDAVYMYYIVHGKSLREAVYYIVHGKSLMLYILSGV